MKPDGVATAPAEPTEAPEAATMVEEAAKEGQPQEDPSPSPPQQEPVNVQGAESTVPPPEKVNNGKTSQPKPKTKTPVRTKPGTAVTKTATTSGVSRPAPAQNRVANGVARTAANGATKRPAAASSEVKKSTPAGAAAQAKKGLPTAAVAAKTQTKVAERNPAGTTRPAVTSANRGSMPAAAASTLSKKPATASNSAGAKPKTTVSRPATAPAAKPSTSAASKSTLAPKTTRPTPASASTSTTSTATRKPAVATTKLAASRTASAPSAARSVSLQPSKVSTTTAAAKKDVSKPSASAPARKHVATKTASNTHPTATKASKPEPPKPASAAKRPPADTKTTLQKTDNTKPVPARRVPAVSKVTKAPNNQKQGACSSPVGMKRQATKPTQSVLPLVVKEKKTEEQAEKPVESSSAPVAAVCASTAAAIVAAEPVPEAEATPAALLEEQPNQQTSVPVEVQDDEVVQVPALEPSDVEIVPTVEQADVVEPEAETPVLVLSNSASVPVGHEFKNGDDDYISAEAPTAQEMTQNEPVTTPPLEVSIAAMVPPSGVEVVEKADQLIHNDAEEEEEEKEGSQQVSVSDMSGTQPTEESRPGSAGLAGSMWRAGGLLSELDSEDVSCSQQGASELSAPGVLEGTESMDDLGEASLKGADGEGASAGSPDFEKVPDIPANEEDDDYDDEDRVCDMEVGSERAEDPHRQCHEDEEEDEDVEMASEGITESGLESYGNADEDDFAEDYRLDNLNRMQPPPIFPSAPPAAQCEQLNPFADPWVHPLQPDTTHSCSPPSSPWQANSETLTQAPQQAWLDVENARGGPSCQPPALMEPIPSSPQLAPVPSAEKEAGLSLGLATLPQGMSNTTSDQEQAAHSCSDSSTPEDLKANNINISGMENLQQPVPVNPVPAPLPDIMQDLGVRLEHGDEDEEPETLPADDVLGGPATAPTSVPSSPSSATEDEGSDTEGEMQISEPGVEPIATADECLGSTQVTHSLSTLEEREEACVETEGGGSDTPQSATSAASYGFDCTTTSNSNAQSTTESCAKSPGIFSLENEEQLPEEAKDPSLIKELNLDPTCAPGDVDKLHPEQQGDLQYMLCGKANEDLPESCSLGGTDPTEMGSIAPSSSQHQEDWDLDAQHPYYSTICEKTDGSLAGRNVQTQWKQDVLTVHMTMSPKRRTRPRVDHVTNPPRLPTDLPPRMPSAGPNAQLRRLEHHQQRLLQIEQRREQQSQWSESREEEKEGKKDEGGDHHDDDDDDDDDDDEEKEERNQTEEELEGERRREEKEKELEEQKRDLLQLQILQQQQELKQRQQIMQWQEELEQQQNKQQNKQKTVTKVLLSPSGLCTIYEALETSDSEDEFTEEKEDQETVMEVTVEHENSKEMCSQTAATDPPMKDTTASPQTQSTCSLKLIQEQVVLTHAESHPSLEQPSPLELDWGKKVDIVQQLINQTLLLAGDSCSPLLLPGGTGGTLSPLETSLWPNLLQPLAPSTATVTSVSSFSPEAAGTSPQGEWTVVELETHH